MAEKSFTWGLGRRKNAVARVRMIAGSGLIRVNGAEFKAYFTDVDRRNMVLAPLRLTGTAESFDVFSSVEGGGPTGQAGATSLGIARALKKINPSFEEKLRAEGLLTRDARMKERKKYGKRGARRGVQFSKR